MLRAARYSEETTIGPTPPPAWLVSGCPAKKEGETAVISPRPNISRMIKARMPRVISPIIQKIMVAILSDLAGSSCRLLLSLPAPMWFST
jgi:hypothetical protein